ncbi:MAG TPA: SDR family NAD(P)-dependent oxidoreductase [Bacteroidota bacterium]|nr:SDR family NAD(P)-dependent oxidoreductase [Bacteroidota bacterium]
MQVKGKVALITGGTGELGRAVVRLFLREGAEVAVTYFSEEERARFGSDFPDVLALRGDLSKEREVSAVFDELINRKGTLDILCNLVGGYMPKKDIADLSEKEWDFMFGLNLKTVFLSTRRAIPLMAKSGFGRIINVSAMAGLEPSAGRGAYGVSKAAIETFTAIAGAEAKAMSGKNITVNAIAPSVLLTEANRSSASEEEIRTWVPLEQAADVILYLASEAASAVNGVTLRVYGKI